MSKKSIKLHELNKQDMDDLKGGMMGTGNCCGCACAYADSGGSSVDSNHMANYDGGLFSPQDAVAWTYDC